VFWLILERVVHKEKMATVKRPKPSMSASSDSVAKQVIFGRKNGHDTNGEEGRGDVTVVVSMVDVIKLNIRHLLPRHNPHCVGTQVSVHNICVCNQDHNGFDLFVVAVLLLCCRCVVAVLLRVGCCCCYVVVCSCSVIRCLLLWYLCDAASEQQGRDVAQADAPQILDKHQALSVVRAGCWLSLFVAVAVEALLLCCDCIWL
jgi:hypothetical protein